MEYGSDDDTNCKLHADYSQQRIDTGTWGLGNKKDEWRPFKRQHY